MANMGLGTDFSARARLGPGGLTVWTDQDAERCVFRLKGSLNAETVSLLNHHIDLLGRRSCEQVVVDLAGLEKLDTVGARLIVGLAHYVSGRGGTLSVQGTTPYMETLLADARLELG